MKAINWIFTVFSFLFLLNCASNVKAKKINDQNPLDYKTYAYLPDTGLNASAFNRELGPSVDDTAIIKMKNKMSELGFSIDVNNPDMLVLISDSNTIKSNLKKDGTNSAASQSSSTAMSPYSGSSGTTTSKRFSSNNNTPSTRPYQNGNMVIEFFNSKNKQLIWVGTAKNFKTDIAGQNLTGMMVDAIFAKFPKK